VDGENAFLGFVQRHKEDLGVDRLNPEAASLGVARPDLVRHAQSDQNLIPHVLAVEEQGAVISKPASSACSLVRSSNTSLSSCNSSLADALIVQSLSSPALQAHSGCRASFCNSRNVSISIIRFSSGGRSSSEAIGIAEQAQIQAQTSRRIDVEQEVKAPGQAGDLTASGPVPATAPRQEVRATPQSEAL
jgi:Flp pilus assembly secretin CpaC